MGAEAIAAREAFGGQNRGGTACHHDWRVGLKLEKRLSNLYPDRLIYVTPRHVSIRPKLDPNAREAGYARRAEAEDLLVIVVQKVFTAGEELDAIADLIGGRQID